MRGYGSNKRGRCGKILLAQIGDMMAICGAWDCFLGFSSVRRRVRELEAVMTRLFKFVDEGIELREGRN